MRARVWGGFALAFLAASSAACVSPEESIGCSLSIEKVSIIPMDREQVLHGRTVRIADGRMQSITLAGQADRACDLTVDGSGKFLLPGLNDMHVHVESDMFVQALGAPPPPENLEDALFIYLVHGVTGIRVMSGSPDTLAFRDSGRVHAPRMLVGSPMLSGPQAMMPPPLMRPLATALEARSAVNGYADLGYDFIKIRENLPADVLDAVIKTAGARKLLVDGHAPRDADVFANGRRGVAHVNELSLLVTDGARDPASIARRAKACDCFVTSTLVIETNVAAQLRDHAAMEARQEARLVHPQMKRALWDKARNPYLAEAQDPVFFDRLRETDKLILRELRNQSVPLLAGTDALIPMIVPGASLHDELALLVDAGLSPFEAISAATRTPSEIFAKFGDLGVVAEGRSANLLLVGGNPLVDVSVLRRHDAVILRGEYFDRARLDQRMEELAAGFAR